MHIIDKALTALIMRKQFVSVKNTGVKVTQAFTGQPSTILLATVAWSKSLPRSTACVNDWQQPGGVQERLHETWEHGGRSIGTLYLGQEYMLTLHKSFTVQWMHVQYYGTGRLWCEVQIYNSTVSNKKWHQHSSLHILGLVLTGHVWWLYIRNSAKANSWSTENQCSPDNPLKQYYIPFEKRNNVNYAVKVYMSLHWGNL